MTTVSKPDLPGFEERRIRYRATGIRYLVGGSGPAVALVHGLGGFAGNWRAIAPALAAERRVIVPELPGHGRSEPLRAAPTLDPFAEAMLAVLEAEDALPAPWVGHSLGGLVGLRAAARRPAAVTGLVLAAAAGISSASRIGEATVTAVGVVKPGVFSGGVASSSRAPGSAARSRSAGGASRIRPASSRSWPRRFSPVRLSTPTR